MKLERNIVRTLERLGLAVGYGTPEQFSRFAEQYENGGFAYFYYNGKRPARVGWYNYAIVTTASAQVVEAALKNEFDAEIKTSTRGDFEVINAALRYKTTGDRGGGFLPPAPDVLNFTMHSGGTIQLKRFGTPNIVTLEYSIDRGETWQEWVETNKLRELELPAGTTMYLRNTSETSTGFSTSGGDCYRFVFSSNCKAAGRINSLLCINPDDVELSNYCFTSLFYECDKLMTPPILESLVMKQNCYSSLFYKCTNLQYAPELPATTLAPLCYSAMFRECSSIKIAPELPAETLDFQCYQYMLFGTGIEKSPLLHVENLAGGCYYYMFGYCGSLKEIKTNMKTLDQDSLTHWVKGVPAVGDFYCQEDLTISIGENGIPSGWIRHNIE